MLGTRGVMRVRQRSRLRLPLRPTASQFLFLWNPIPAVGKRTCPVRDVRVSNQVAYEQPHEIHTNLVHERCPNQRLLVSDARSTDSR